MGNNTTDWTVLAVIILIMGGIGGYMITNVSAGKDEFTGKGGSAVTKKSRKQHKGKSHRKR